MIESANNVIVFSYKREDLFNDVSLLSAYMVKNMVITQPEETQDYFRVDATFQKWRQTKTATYKAGNNLTMGKAKFGVIAQ